MDLDAFWLQAQRLRMQIETLRAQYPACMPSLTDEFLHELDSRADRPGTCEDGDSQDPFAKSRDRLSPIGLKRLDMHDGDSLHDARR